MSAEYIWGLGRRKTAVARVRVRPGSGVFLVNKQPMNEYFESDDARLAAVLPLRELSMETKYDVLVNVAGGGKKAQAGAVLMGLSRALLKENEGFEPILREKGLLTRDPRMKERKKPGQRGARARFQFSKR